MVSGIYLFGSALVYISLLWNGAPYPLELAFPPIIGIGFGIIYPIWVLRNLPFFSHFPQKVHQNEQSKECEWKRLWSRKA